jgi:hypothetical protein
MFGLPDFTGDEREIDLKVHYYQHRRIFFGVAIANTLVSLSKDVILTGHLPDPANVGFHLVFIATAAAAMRRRARVVSSPARAKAAPDDLPVRRAAVHAAARLTRGGRASAGPTLR